MVENIYIIHYRKLKGIRIDLTKNVNIISGVNGTCKSSILHLVSNAFQDILRKDSESHIVISGSNRKWNPKIENLTKGDKTNNDPANGTKGELLKIKYYGLSEEVSFRRHNSSENDRYRLIPKYAKGSETKLPKKPRIYLGTSRFANFAEIDEGDLQSKVIKKKKMPKEYLQDLRALYEKIARHSIDVESFSNYSLPSIKTMPDFVTDKEGVDSNTISSGEDNLMAILYALISLKYYYDTTNLEDKSSILLIDELDATLHPNVQKQVLETLREYSQNFEIQIIATTHSMSLIDEACRKRDNIVYLMETAEGVQLLSKDQTDLSTIHMHLSASSLTEIHKNKYVTCFVEDEEARLLLDWIFNYYEINCDRYNEFSNFHRFFYPITARLGCEQLKSIMSDLPWAAFAILDQDNNIDLDKKIIVLPGDGNKLSPEKMIHNYYRNLLSENKVSKNKEIMDCLWVQIPKERLDNMFYQLEVDLKRMDKPQREIYKKHFQTNKNEYKLLFRVWMEENNDKMKEFYNNLVKMFNKNAAIAGIYARMKEVTN